MNDDGFADDLTQGKPAGQEHLEGVPPVFTQRGQISGVGGMGTVVPVVMGQGVCKGGLFVSTALAAAVDMESEDPSAAGAPCVGEPAYFGGHENAPLRLIKAHRPGDTRIGSAAEDPRYCVGPLPEEGDIAQKRFISNHKTNSRHHCMSFEGEG